MAEFVADEKNVRLDSGPSKRRVAPPNSKVCAVGGLRGPRNLGISRLRPNVGTGHPVTLRAGAAASSRQALEAAPHLESGF